MCLPIHALCMNKQSNYCYPHVQDFATSSLRGEVVRDEAIGPVQVELEDLEQYQIVERKRWEQR